MAAQKLQFPKPTAEQLAAIRKLLPPKTENTTGLTPPFQPLQDYLAAELDLDMAGACDREVYAAGWSLLWGARRRHLREIEDTLETAVELRESGEGGGHAALRQALSRLGYTTSASAEAESLAHAVIARGKL